MTTLSKGELCMFVKDFGAPLHRNRVLNAFNKTSELRQPIDFPDFLKFFENLAPELNLHSID